MKKKNTLNNKQRSRITKDLKTCRRRDLDKTKKDALLYVRNNFSDVIKKLSNE